MIDLLERGLMYPPLDVCVDAGAVYDAIAATDVCEPAGSSFKFHLISVRDRMTYGFISKFFQVVIRDVLADCLVKGGIDRGCCAMSAVIASTMQFATFWCTGRI